jgi:flagellar motor switch/type III secretory pathway protein FliN
MSERVREWAPLQAAASSDVVRRKLDAAVAAWNDRWFPSGRLETSLTVTRAGRRADNGGAWRASGDGGVATSYPHAGADRLALRALGVRFEGLTLTAADHSVISALSRRIADDLALTIEGGLAGHPAPRAPSAFPGDDEAADAWHGGVTLTVADIRGPLLAAAIPLEQLAPVCKAAMGSPRQSSRPLADPRDTIGPTQVRLDAVLGRAHLKLAELRSLAPGDVVVLDSTIDDGIDLSLPDFGACVARGRLGERQGWLTLTLQTHPS